MSASADVTAASSTLLCELCQMLSGGIQLVGSHQLTAIHESSRVVTMCSSSVMTSAKHESMSFDQITVFNHVQWMTNVAAKDVNCSSSSGVAI